jgi:hypothetical protein
VAGGGGGGETRATALSLGRANLALPWEFGFTVAFNGPPPGAGGDSYCQMALGDESGAWGGANNILYLDVDGTYGTTGRATLNLMDGHGGAASATVPWPLGRKRQVTFTWDGTKQRAYVDGVQMVVAALRNPGQITLKDLSLEIAGDDSAAGWRIYDFHYRLTGA